MAEPTLPFPNQPHRAAPLSLKRLGARAAFWAPVWIPMVVLGQVALLGLGPALAEARRLDGAEAELGARIEGARAERDELERALRAQSDPIYLERERRMLRTERGPLTSR